MIYAMLGLVILCTALAAAAYEIDRRADRAEIAHCRQMIDLKDRRIKAMESTIESQKDIIEILSK